MILYQLICSNEHRFEAWFRDSATYDQQATTGDIDCPFCGDIGISKAPMAPRLSKGISHDPDRHRRDNRVTVATVDEGMSLPDSDTPAGDGRAAEVAEQILKAVNLLREYVEKNYDDVGEQFADEVRRIHYGEAEERGIYGQATEDESRELAEEGIEHVRLPSPARKNS